MVTCSRVMVTKMKGCVQTWDMFGNKSANGLGIEGSEKGIKVDFCALA